MPPTFAVVRQSNQADTGNGRRGEYRFAIGLIIKETLPETMGKFRPEQAAPMPSMALTNWPIMSGRSGLKIKIIRCSDGLCAHGT